MLMLTQQRDRPEIPPLDTLPGQPLPGIDDYIGLMQVLYHAHTKLWTYCDSPGNRWFVHTSYCNNESHVSNV